MKLNKSQIVCNLTGALVLLVLSPLLLCAMNLDTVETPLVNGDYKAAIRAGEKIMGDVTHNSPDVDRLYYLLATSYIKDGNYLRAWDIFEILLSEFPQSPYKNLAQMGLADTYFLRGKYDEAGPNYKKLLSSTNVDKNLYPLIYYKLSQCALKTGNTKEAEEFMQKLKKEFPASLEASMSTSTTQTDESVPSVYYTVQAGSFADKNNALELNRELSEKGYQVFIDEATTPGGKRYRVRVGKFSARQEAQDMEKKLSHDGYSTIIYP